MAECDHPPTIPSCWAQCLNDRELLAVIGYELCQILETGIPSGPPVGTQDVNVVSSVTLTVQGDTGRTWTLDFATDQVDVSGSSVSVSNFPASFSVTQGTSPWVVAATDLDIRNLVFATDKVDTSGSVVALDAATLAALETVTVLQGTSPWVVSGTVTSTPSGTQDVNIVSSITLTVQATDLDIRNLAFATDKVDVSGSSVSAIQSGAWTTGRTWDLSFASDQVDASGSVVALDAATLAALETITVLQGTNPWVVSGTVTATPTGTQDVNIVSSITLTVQATDLDIRNLAFATDKVDASGSVVALDAATLAALETITVIQGTNPWIVSATDLDIRNLVFATDKVDVSGSTVAPVVGTTGGATPFRNAAVTNTAVAVKAAAGKVWSYNIFNPGVALAYLHFYDLASGSVVVGTTVPTRSVALQSNATAQVGIDSSFAVGIQFSTAISIAASTTPGGGTAPGTALVVNIDYA